MINMAKILKLKPVWERIVTNKFKHVILDAENHSRNVLHVADLGRLSGVGNNV
jgi:hypothetical protein